MPIRLITAPATEPVSLQEAKSHLRVDIDDDDDIINLCITAARQHAESETCRAFVTQQWALYLDHFPPQGYCGGLSGTINGATTLGGFDDALAMSASTWMSNSPYAVRIRRGRIELPFPQLQSIESIKYLDVDGLEQTLDPALYTADTIGEPGAVLPARGCYWPQGVSDVNAVEIRYMTGYGDATSVPPGIKAWIKMRIGAMYENREEFLVGQRLVVAELPFVDRLLDPFRIVRYV